MKLARHSVELARSSSKGTDSFQRLARPYGPLDISDAPGCSDGEFRALRNFYFGFSAQPFSADTDVIANRFFCQDDCWRKRRDSAAAKLESISKVVEKFRAHPKLILLSEWTGEGSYRINDVVVSKDGSLRLALPSQEAGLVPSGEWLELRGEDLPKRLKALSLSKRDLQRLVNGLKENSISALKREPDGGIRAIVDGFADNEWGLLFGSNGSAPNILPGPSLSGAKEISGSESLRSDVIFYLTGAKLKGLQL